MNNTLQRASDYIQDRKADLGDFLIGLAAEQSITTINKCSDNFDFNTGVWRDWVDEGREENLYTAGFALGGVVDLALIIGTTAYLCGNRSSPVEIAAIMTGLKAATNIISLISQGYKKIEEKYKIRD